VTGFAFAFLFLFLSDTFYFENPRVKRLQADFSQDTIPGSEENFVASDSFSFKGSKGFFVTFDGNSFILSQALDLTLGGSLGKNVKISGRLRDSNVQYGNDVYTIPLKDADEVYLEISRPPILSLRLGKIYTPFENLLGFSFDFQNFHLLYGVSSTNVVRKEVPVEFMNQGPYFIDFSYKIVPGSLKLIFEDKEVERDKFEFYYPSGALYIKDPALLEGRGKVFVEYKSYSLVPLNFAEIQYKTNLGTLTFYRASDSKGFYEGLPVEIRDFLVQSGDSAGVREYRGGIKAEGGDYILKDSIFVFVGNGNGDYQVFFEWVGAKKGSYIFDNLLGGYRYVGKDSGDYEPLVRIKPPRETYLLSFAFDSQSILDLNFSLSYSDLNALSPRDDGDNLGGRLDVSKVFTVRESFLKLGFRGQTAGYNTIYPMYDRFWGVEGEKNFYELYGDFLWEKYQVKANYSVRFLEKSPHLFLRFEYAPGPFFFNAHIYRGDSLVGRAFVGWKSKRLPDGLLTFSNSEKRVSFHISDGSENFAYTVGVFYDGVSQTFSPYGSLEIKDMGQFFSYDLGLSYIPRYLKVPLYVCDLHFNFSPGITLGVGASRNPALQSLKEERYFRSPFGAYDYDSLSGLFVPSPQGAYDRSIVELNAVDTTLRSTYYAGLELKSFATSFDLDLASDVWGTSRTLTMASSLLHRGMTLKGSHSQTLDFSFVDTLRRRKTELLYSIPVYKPCNLLLRYEGQVEESFSYKVYSAGGEVLVKLGNVRVTVDKTDFAGRWFNSLSLSGFVNYEKTKVKLFANLFLSYPVNGKAGKLPLWVPTSKRFGGNLNFKYRYKDGEFFVEANLIKSGTSYKRIRGGYNFLF